MARLARLRDWSMLLVCNLIWGSQFVIYKIVQRQAGPVFAPLFPIFIALLLLIPLVRAERKRRNAEFTLTHGRDILEFLLIGVFGQVVAQVFVAWSVRFTLASNAALLALALPIVTALMAYLFLGERMTPMRWLSFALAIAGVVEMSGIRWGQLDFTSRRYLLGNLMVLLAISGSAFYNSYSKKLLRRYSPLEVLLYSYCVFVLAVAPIALYTEPQTFRNMPHFTPLVWLCFFLLAVFQYFVAMVLFLNVLTRLDATQAGLSNYLITFFGVLAAVLVVHERLTPVMVIGGILVLASTLLITIYEQKVQSA